MPAGSGRWTPGRHVALVGTTASGKSTLALALAERRPGVEVVSVDSMAVYREMDIATAKPTAEERRRVRHHMVDVADPGEAYGVARYQQEATAALGEVERRGARALLVGGTGLYLRALVDQLRIPGQWPEVAADLAGQASRPGGTDLLFARLRQLDPQAAARIEPGNTRRLLRALEVTLGSGQPFSSFGAGLQQYGSCSVTLVGLRFDRQEVDRRIRNRLERWMSQGLLHEVQQLACRPGGLSRTARQAVAYRELLSHVEDAAPLADCLSGAESRTRSLARRQWAWFRRDPRIYWLEPTDDPLAQLLQVWDEAPAVGSCRGIPVGALP